MGSGAQSEMADALARLWTKFLPDILERVRVLESAGAALSAGTLGAEERAAAAAAAHKLAGVLGTFGLAEGTALAREAEASYSANSASDLVGAPRLRQIAIELDKIIRARG
jgi:HPt (histidine-containing phosphotransfer) domain-containing protein